MDARKHFLVATALIETGAGLALLLAPRIAFDILLTISPPSTEALVVARLASAALLALGIACWLARKDRGSASRQGLLCGMLVYNVGAAVLLGYAGSILRMTGILLWPAVVLHTALAIWCVLCLRASPAGK